MSIRPSDTGVAHTACETSSLPTRDDIVALADNARRNRADLLDPAGRWRDGGRGPEPLSAWRRVAAVVEPEALGALVTFAHADDLPIIFDTLGELLDDPATLRSAADTLAVRYLDRGFEHIGRRLSEVPLRHPESSAGPPAFN